MIIYQVYLRSFYSSKNKSTGDIAGITAKLNYIKSLGVDYVWISPFFKSPMKDFGYDIADYRQVDLLFGTMEDFNILLDKSKLINLKIMVDLVASHTSNEHQWFKDSINKKNDREEWYLWADAKPDGTPPNNWLSVFGGSAWQWEAQRQQYYFHSFLSSQPDLNMHCVAVQVQDQILSEMEFWLKKGVSGFRLDACNHYFQDLLLRNNPSHKNNTGKIKPYAFQNHIYDQGRPENILFLKRIRKLLDHYDAYSLAEVGGNDALTLTGEYTKKLRLHSAYSFALLKGDGSSDYIKEVVETLESKVVTPGRPCYAMSNHDKPRVASRWSINEDTDSTEYQMMALLSVMKGNICIYQGEELGLTETDISFEQIQDPYGKDLWPVFKGRDGCRTPMPWNSTLSGGFSFAKPWLPIPDEHKKKSVSSQEKNKKSLLNITRKMLKFRNENKLSSGNIEFLNLGENILAFTRRCKDKNFLCIFNRSLELKNINQIEYIEKVFFNKVKFTNKIEIDVNGFCILEIK